jgi:signal-transduction protein with cAMP-binding, CBS, and nucleotidyltransferase domain
MNERLEKLFLPEKLRKKWEKSAVPTAGQSQNSGMTKISDILDVFNRTSLLILNEYKDDKLEILKILLENIKKELDEFVIPGSDNHQSAATGLAVIEQIHQLEDLIEAF